LERRAVVGVAEKDELVELFPPSTSRLFGITAGAAGDEPAQAVADDDEIFQFYRPFGDQRLQPVGEGAAIHRDVQARIVGEVDRREAEIAGERRAMVVVLARPFQVAHAEPVDEHGEFSGRLRERVGQRASLERERPAVAAEPHFERERIGGFGKMVADDPVEHGERDLPPARDRPIVRLRVEERRGGADAFAGQPERAADAAIDEPRHPARQPLRERGETGRIEDGIVHMLDHPGEALRRVGGEAAEAEGVGERNCRGLRRHGICLRVGLTTPRRICLILSGFLGNRPAAHSAMPTGSIAASRTMRLRIAHLHTVLYGLDITPFDERQYSSVWNMPGSRLGPTEWVNAGLNALARFGFAALKADTLANRLHVSRGSFYWHFPHVSAFHAAILRRWREIALENIIDNI